jgi:hypothetical protein
MSADAVVLFRPKDPAKLRPFLDLDDESEESEGLYAEALDDGAMLAFTFQPFEVFEQNPGEAREWLAQFGDALPDVHDDPRGLLVFPDTCEPEATTYDAVVAEVGDEGVWLTISDDDASGLDEQAAGWPPGELPPIDMQTLQAFAGQLLGSGDAPATSFQVAKLFENVQQELLDALGMREMQQETTNASRPESADEGTDEDHPEDDDGSDPKKPGPREG